MGATSLHDVPKECWRLIFKFFIPNQIYCQQALFKFIKLRFISKIIRNNLDDEFFITILHSRAFTRRIKHAYFASKITKFTKFNDTRGLREFLELYCKIRGEYETDIQISYYLDKIVLHGSIEFLREFKNMTVNSKKLKLSLQASDVINSFSAAYAKQKFDTAEFTLHLLAEYFGNINPQHVDEISKALKEGKPLFLKQKLLSSLKDKLSDRNNEVSTELLLELLSPDLKKIIVPEGRLVDLPEIMQNKTRYKKGNMPYMIGPLTDNTRRIIYRDAIGTEHKIVIEQHGNIYTYDGYASDNLYAVMVHTRLFDELFGTYPQQHVALTHECLALPLEDQPWFFGAISDQEASNLLGSAFAKSFLVRTVGARVQLQFGGSRTLPILDGKVPLLSEMFTGIYNHGIVKDMVVHEFFKLVVAGDFKKIKKFVEDNDLDLSQPCFSQPNAATVYLQTTSPNKDIVKWLINQGVAAEQSQIRLSGRDLDMCLFLVQHGAECDRDTLNEAISNPTTLEDFKHFYESFTKAAVNKTEVPQKLRRLILNGDAYQGKFVRWRSRLVAMTWQFGNDDNYFKMLPRELIHEISKFGIDPPLITEIAEIMMPEVKDNDISFYPTKEFTADVTALIWKYWSKISSHAQNLIIDNLLLKDDTNIVGPRAWCGKIKTIDPRIISKYGQQLIINGIQNNEVEFIREILKVLKNEIPLWRDDAIGQDIPVTWLTLQHDQEDMAKILMAEDLMPRTNGNNLTIEAYAKLIQYEKNISDILAVNVSE